VSTGVDFSAASPQLAHTPRCQPDPNKSRFSSRHLLIRPSVGHAGRERRRRHRPAAVAELVIAARKNRLITTKLITSIAVRSDQQHQRGAAQPASWSSRGYTICQNPSGTTPIVNKAAVSLGHARNRFQHPSRSMAPEHIALFEPAQGACPKAPLPLMRALESARQIEGKSCLLSE
jgi:hypothetical protein